MLYSTSEYFLHHQDLVILPCMLQFVIQFTIVLTISQFTQYHNSQYHNWRRKWQSTPVLLPGESHGGRSLAGYSPWGHKKSDTTERLHFHFHHLHRHRYTSWQGWMFNCDRFCTPVFVLKNFTWNPQGAFGLPQLLRSGRLPRRCSFWEAWGAVGQDQTEQAREGKSSMGRTAFT